MVGSFNPLYIGSMVKCATEYSEADKLEGFNPLYIGSMVKSMTIGLHNKLIMFQSPLYRVNGEIKAFSK